MIKDRTKGISIILFAVLYLIYTVYIVKHGLMMVNGVAFSVVSLIGVTFLFKKEDKQVNRKTKVKEEKSRELTESEKKLKTYLVITALVLFIVFLIGIFWLASGPAMTVGLTLSFAAGLSMIVLPCTFPLVFVIVPLSMGEGYKKGFRMALLFSLGLIITLTLYGVAVALLGRAFSLDKVTSIMFLIAGSAAWLFGLSELGLIHFKIPTYGGATPQFIQKQGDYLKALFLGLFLGNAGVACPNPATYVILTYIAGSGSVLYGAALQSVNGLGRATPLVALSILGIIGVNATGWLIKNKAAIKNIIGWSLIVVGTFILVMGIFGHHWLLTTGLHEGWNRIFAGTGATEYECCIEPPCQMCLQGKWKFEKGACQCRMHLEEGNLDMVCPECKIGLAEGKSIFIMAEKTTRYALSTLGALLIIPVVWYFVKRKRSGQNKEIESNGKTNNTGKKPYSKKR